MRCRICGKEMNQNEGAHISMTVVHPQQTNICLGSFCMECFDKYLFIPLSDLNHNGRLGMIMNTGQTHVMENNIHTAETMDAVPVDWIRTYMKDVGLTDAKYMLDMWEKEKN